MILKIEGFKEVLDILKGLFTEIKSAAQIPEINKKEMKEALAATAELIDETLTILKQHLSSVLSELKFGDKQNARKMIYELGDFQGWEDKLRQFQLCDKLREATYNLERKGLYKLLNNFSFNDPDEIRRKMDDYIGGESRAGVSVGLLLENLSHLESKVDTEYDLVVKNMEDARIEIANWRQIFMDFEKEMRDTMG